MSKKRRRPKDTVRDALRASFAIPETLVLTQPLVHINCNGWIELENCGGVLEYSVQKIVFGFLQKCTLTEFANFNFSTYLTDCQHNLAKN